MYGGDFNIRLPEQHRGSRLIGPVSHSTGRVKTVQLVTCSNSRGAFAVYPRLEGVSETEIGLNEVV
jgi:hypothetical protein